MLFSAPTRLKLRIITFLFGQLTLLIQRGGKDSEFARFFSTTLATHFTATA